MDCALCPRFQSKSASRCPGCMAVDFPEKHPSCGISSCCVKKHGFETCAECQKMPCNRLKGWDLKDSFISHQKSIENLKILKEMGIEFFNNNQLQRKKLLEKLIIEFNEGRSKSYYCIATTLLPSLSLKEIRDYIHHIEKDNSFSEITPFKERVKSIKSFIEKLAKKEIICLKLRK